MLAIPSPCHPCFYWNANHSLGIYAVESTRITWLCLWKDHRSRGCGGLTALTVDEVVSNSIACRLVLASRLSLVGNRLSFVGTSGSCYKPPSPSTQKPSARHLTTHIFLLIHVFL